MTDSACPCETAHPPDPRWVRWLAWTLAVDMASTFALLHWVPGWPPNRYLGLAMLVLFVYSLPVIARGEGHNYMSIRARLVFSAIFGTIFTVPVLVAIAVHP